MGVLLIFGFSFNCSKEKSKFPLQNSMDNNTILSKELDGGRPTGELMIWNKTGSTQSFSVDRIYPVEVWDGNYRFTSSYKHISCDDVENNTAEYLDHVNVGPQTPDFAYSKYKITMDGSSNYVIIDYRDDEYKTSSSYYTYYDVEVLWYSTTNCSLKTTPGSTIYATDLDTTIWGLLGDGQHTSEFEKVRVNLTGPSSLRSSQMGTFKSQPKFFYSFSDSKWWVRAGDDDEEKREKKERAWPPPGDTWEELTTFQGDTVISYGTSIDFWIKTEVEDNNSNSDIDSMYVHVE